MHSEYPDFCFDTGHELNLHSALGNYYNYMGRYEEAKKMLEEAWRVCKEENLEETKDSALVAAVLGLTYQ